MLPRRDEKVGEDEEGDDEGQQEQEWEQEQDHECGPVGGR